MDGSISHGGTGSRIRQAAGYPPIPPIHLAIRFLLELAMLAGIGWAGWHLWRHAGAILTVLAAGAFWGLFGTPGDGSRGAPVVETAGPLRLALEMGLFALAGYGFWVGWSRAASETFLTVTALHYVITWERNWWLLRGAPLPETDQV